MMLVTISSPHRILKTLAVPPNFKSRGVSSRSYLYRFAVADIEAFRAEGHQDAEEILLNYWHEYDFFFFNWQQMMKKEAYFRYDDTWLDKLREGNRSERKKARRILKQRAVSRLPLAVGDNCADLR